MVTARNPFTARYLALRAFAFVVVTTGMTFMMAVPYLA